MTAKEIEKIYRYFELSKMKEELDKEIRESITKNSDIDMDCGTWLVGIVELEEQYDENRKEYYVYDKRYRAYEQNNYFIWQVTQFEDSYYGCIYYPLKDNKYLEIQYDC